VVPVTDEALTAGAVARRLGVAVTTLRTWHQRYGLGPSKHVPGQHRRYTSEDLDRLQVMRRLTAQGVAPAEAAAWARRVPVPLDGVPPFATAPARDGGGQAISVGRAGPAARGIARAAMRLDAPALRDILEVTLQGRGVVPAWDDVIVPVLVGIGERYEATNRFIEVEHLISRTVTEVLGGIPRPPADAVPHVLLAAADEEQHTLPLEALAAALAEAGIPSRLLGARMPTQALIDAVTRTGPAAVVVWSQLPETGDPAQLHALQRGPYRPLLIAAGGPGWSGVPDGISHLTSLGSALDAISTVVTRAA
jgi:MerR family transcriptional regulator, light-induced transcriptional regulator